MEKKISFTKTALLNMPNVEKRTRIADQGNAQSVNALFLYVQPSGNKTFYYRRRLNGKYVEVKIGGFPAVTVDNARRRAKELAVDFDRGINPNDIKREAREANTINDLFDNYQALFELDVKAGVRRQSSLNGSERLYRLHIKPILGNKPIDQFDKKAAKAFLQKILSARGYSLHNHCLTLLKSMFNRADLPNPLLGLSKIDEAVHRRERVLSREELQRLFSAMEQEDQIYQDVVMLLLLTGQRKACVLSMEWKEINHDQKLWVIPVSKIKSKKPHVVPLSHAAMKILMRRSNDAAKNEKHVFPSNTSVSGHIAEKTGHSSFWRRITQRAGLHSSDRDENVRIHDLRRTLATYQVSNGGSLQATSKLLGHSSIAITNDVYAHLAVDVVRNELERTT
ncbi:site-specific integrase, partial [Vibrio cholerae]|nr:site-specific integrase [Vibrio cholerae]